MQDRSAPGWRSVFRHREHVRHLPSPRETRRDYIGQIDEFAVYCPATEGVYLIPIEDVLARTGAYLRVDPPLNGQRKHIRWAKDYEVARIRCLTSDGP